jgi:hypothetical protein
VSVVVHPLAFVEEALAARGALVEAADWEVLAVLPPPLAAALGVAEDIRLSLDPGAAGCVPCGFGAPVLEALVSEARAAVPTAWVRLEGRPPSAAQAQAAASRLVLRNGLCDWLDVTPGEATYVSAYFALAAEADDRHEALVHVVMEAASGGEPDPALGALLDPLSASARVLASDVGPRPGDVDRLAARATFAAREALGPFCASVERRKDRDRQRIEEYFAALVADARAPRRPVPEASIRAKVEHLEAERRQKLRDLDARFTVRGTLTPAAFVVARVPVARVRVRVRRRKAEGEITLTVPADARSPDRVPCAGCPRSTLRPVACDDRLHLLCEVCTPAAQGRPRCLACNRR